MPEILNKPTLGCSTTHRVDAMKPIALCSHVTMPNVVTAVVTHSFPKCIFRPAIVSMILAVAAKRPT